MLTNVTKIFDKNFHEIDKQDTVRFCNTLENRNYSSWTKRNYKIIFKTFFT
jgi:hypothetical protein